jgi:uncharacterized protein DUF6249
MGSELIIVPVIFLTFFGMVYYFLLTRNKERLALIEAGADAKLFKSAGNNWYFVIVLGLLAIGISLGAGLGMMIEQAFGKGEDFEQGYVIGIFLFAGLGLLASFFLIRKIKKEDGE